MEYFVEHFERGAFDLDRGDWLRSVRKPRRTD